MHAAVLHAVAHVLHMHTGDLYSLSVEYYWVYFKLVRWRRMVLVSGVVVLVITVM